MPSSRSWISPVCTPILSRIGANGARCISRAAASASDARANAATKLSPSPCSTGRTPSCAAMRPAPRLIEPGKRGGHLLGLGLPEPRGALDVGQ